MKKLGFILVSALILASCGQSAKAKAEAEQARLDSIAQAEAVAAEELRIADSIAQAEAEAIRLAEEEALLAAEAAKTGKKSPAKVNTPAPKQEEVVTVATEKTVADKKADAKAGVVQAAEQTIAEKKAAAKAAAAGK